MNSTKNTMNKVWFITGAGSGLGTGIAKAALSAGDRVVAWGRDGLRLYARDGRLLRRALRGADLRYVRIRDRYAYAAEEASADVVDLVSGRETRGADSNLVYGLLLP